MEIQNCQRDANFIESILWASSGVTHGLSAISCASAAIALPFVGAILSQGSSHSYRSSEPLIFVASVGLAFASAALAKAQIKVAQKCFNHMNF